MDLDNLDPAAFEAMSPEEQRALMENGELPQAAASEPEPAPAPAPEPAQEAAPAVPEPPPAAAPVQAPQPQGDVQVPIRHLRDQIRQHEAILRDPHALKAILNELQPPQAAPPQLAVEDPAVISQIIGQHVAPLQQTVAALQQQLGHARAQAEMADLRSKFPDIDQKIQEFDSQVPPQIAAQKSPMEKYLLTKGREAVDPATQAKQNAAAEARAKELAAQAVATQIKGGPKKETPITLAGVTSSQTNHESRDPAEVDASNFAKLSDKDRRRLLETGDFA